LALPHTRPRRFRRARRGSRFPAHNDYAHARPLFDALIRGFCSIDADILLVDGQQLVTHTRKDAKPGRTLAGVKGSDWNGAKLCQLIAPRRWGAEKTSECDRESIPNLCASAS
jgi:hypothetical protein